MRLSLYVQELLFQYECVTIPNFGAFLTRSFEARVTPKGRFFPPRREVNFNQLLISNDGILAHYFAEKEAIPYEHALRIIEKEVSSWKRRLQTQTLRFPKVGEIHLNTARKIEFTSWEKVNFDLKAFGLKVFDRDPLMIKTIPNLMENSNKDDLMFTPEKKKKTSNKSPLLKYAAIGVIATSLLSLAYYYGDQYITEEKILAQGKAQQQIEKNIQEAAFDLGSIDPIEINLVASSQDVIPDEIYYSVIAGSFRIVENAERKVSQLVDEGYPAAIAEFSPEGLYRVAYGRYSTKKEAINMLYFIKYTLKEEAWYLEEK